jgi:hypothetical protein
VKTLEFAADSASGAERRLTHYLFRYPAKFHPPVVRSLIEEYTHEKDLVYDPFCGSGTLMVEALVSGRNAVGSDVDPVAVFVSSVKTRPLSKQPLKEALDLLDESFGIHHRGKADYDELQFADISIEEFEEEAREVWIPGIPNIEHWFRRYVIVDLARILAAIRDAPLSGPRRKFFLLVFASIIRASSNADPVPVSGLEVTSHMRRIDEKGRIIDPFELFKRAAARAIEDMEAFRVAAGGRTKASAVQADATALPIGIRRRSVSSVITSPPYHGAVDYYRRHQLEMYWLGLVESHDERLRLLQRYVGRTKVASRHPLVRADFLLPPAEASLEAEMRAIDPPRADAFRHYCRAMSLSFAQLGALLAPGRPAIFVVGHSMWQKSSLNTSQLFAELARPSFRLEDELRYPVKNRYMSYARKNGANIDHEYVLVFRRTDLNA